MHFFRAGVANHAHDLPAGGAAHDRIVDQHHALAFEQRAHRIQLQLHAEVAHALAGLDEGAPDVVVADQGEAKRNAALGGVAHGGGHAGIGHGNHEVGVHAGFARQLAAQFLAAGLHRAAEDQAVGTREVHVLEDAARLRRGGRIEARTDSLRADHDQFAGLHIAHVVGADQIERAGLGGKDDGVLLLSFERGNAAHGQRPEAARIAHREDAVVAHHHQRKSAFDAAQRVGHGFGQRLLLGERDQVNDDFGVAVGLENRALTLQPGANLRAH